MRVQQYLLLPIVFMYSAFSYATGTGNPFGGWGIQAVLLLLVFQIYCGLWLYRKRNRTKPIMLRYSNIGTYAVPVFWLTLVASFYINSMSFGEFYGLVIFINFAALAILFVLPIGIWVLIKWWGLEVISDG